MNAHGIMLYGYSKDQAGLIQNHLEALFEMPITVISGKGKESEVVAVIITDEHVNDFGEGSPKILMFLGFSDDEIKKTVDTFHSIVNVQRPIFCGLTEENMQWSLRMLIEHLEEEHRRWTNQK